ncbi:FunK1 protein kinase [Nemania abortiva]|nr:FunK1 protein kinase [Nemania abortiva]
MQNHQAVNDPPVPLHSAMDDQEILDNIDGRMHGPMSRFIQRYFGNFQYVHRDDILEIQAAGVVSSRCAIPQAAPSPDNFLQWFSDYMLRELDGARGSWHVSSGNTAPEHGTRDDGACLLLTIPTSPTCGDRVRWDHVQVIGQFCYGGRVSYQDGLLRLCRSAYQVFDSQPLRLFLHGFYTRGSLIEFWVFDRSGLYCSEVFDIQKDFNQFLSIILSYQRMTDQDLGNNGFIRADKGGSYITLDGADMPSLGKLYLEEQPIASRGGIAGTGTTCYRTRMPDSDRWDYVLKFKWRWVRERPEDELLKLAKKKCVWGAISLDFYKELESTAYLRRMMRWGTGRKFIESTEEQRQKVACDADGLAGYTEETEDYFENRMLTCVVTSPVGRPLHTFRSILELLQVFRDAIKCHRSLYNDGAILHQDISSGNMIILDEQEEGDPRGVLIDLDAAIELAEISESEGRITGTRPFMAIGALKGELHTYRHDLESFFYVFLWAIITDRTDSPPEDSRLRQWSDGSLQEVAARKLLDIEQDGFGQILEEFGPEFCSLKPLAQRLRQFLFPERGGAIWIGTDEPPGDVDRLYDEMICAFEGAIASEGGS